MQMQGLVCNLQRNACCCLGKTNALRLNITGCSRLDKSYDAVFLVVRELEAQNE